jgi:DNA invertase Pin-like site-specific DNA recombinase
MNSNGRSDKVTASHLGRGAYLYVRQSSLRQVAENTESAKRQYALRDRALALGWARDQITVIDDDQGQSGASAVDRAGFQRLAADVSMGRAGIVLGLEVSRLARNSTDWHRLLEVCALSGTLICDEDGLYDPADFNDRLLLGLKGTMSEAELHMIKARLVGGQRSKARRGELRVPLPVGLVYDAADQVVLDPDLAVRESLACVFTVFGRAGTAGGVVQHFRTEGLLFPKRVWAGPDKGSLVWGVLGYAQTLRTLHNPAYAGVFAYGRNRAVPGRSGRAVWRPAPREEWIALIEDHHPGYISWDQYEANQKTLAANSAARGPGRGTGPAREGPALLQGLAVCGRCGHRMSTSYHVRGPGRPGNGGRRLVPDYCCGGDADGRGGRRCLSVAGSGIDAAVARLLLEVVSPLGLEVSIAVQAELEERAAEADRLRHRRVEDAQRRADLARRRYLAVDPANRMVADTLEADWNDQLRMVRDAQDGYDRDARQAEARLTEDHKARIRALSVDFPAMWNNPATLDKDRKRVARLLIEDVTITRDGDRVGLGVRFKGGRTDRILIPAPVHASELFRTDPGVIAELDRLLEDHTDSEAAGALNAMGLVPPKRSRFTTAVVKQLRGSRGLASHTDRLKARGMLTREEYAEVVGVHPATVAKWARDGRVESRRADGKGLRLFWPPSSEHPAPLVGQHKHPNRYTNTEGSAL